MLYEFRDLKGHLSGQPLREFKRATLWIVLTEHGPSSWWVEIELKSEYLKGLAVPHVIGVALRDSAVQVEGQAQIRGFQVEIIETPSGESNRGGWLHREAGEHMTIEAHGVGPLVGKMLPFPPIPYEEGQVLDVKLWHAIRGLPIEVEPA